MHSGVLDRRLKGQYDEVLKEVNNALTSLPTRLPQVEQSQIAYYRRIVSDCRNAWWEVKFVNDNNDIVRGKNARAQLHLEQLEREKQGEKTVHQCAENELEKLRKVISGLETQVGTLTNLLDETLQISKSTRNLGCKPGTSSGYIDANTD